MFKKQTIVALLAVAASSGAYAAPFYLDTSGGSFGSTTGDADKRTADIRELGLTGSLATSIYSGLPGPGTAVTDTNRNSIIGAYAGTHTTLAGTSKTFQTTQSPGNNNVDNLNLVNGALFGSSTFEGFTGTDYGDPGRWGLLFDYTINGAVNGTGTGVNYTSGFFDVFLTLDGSTRLDQVLRLDVDGSALNQANLDIFGHVTFDFDGDGDDDAGAIAQTLFVDSLSGTSFYDLWLAGVGIDPLVISFSLDTNVNPPIPTADQLVCFNDGKCVRQSTLDSSVVFAVPVPAPLALFGIGLVAMGWTARRKQA